MRDISDRGPIVRWAGSKKRILPVISKFFPPFSGKYIEPFAGSACVFFRLNPERACLNDLNIELMNFYSVVARHPHDVYVTFNSLERTSKYYYDLRAEFGDLKNPIERAAAFLYLNRNCFNGIYRVNKRGQFNVPYSDSRVAPYPSYEEFLSSASALKRAELHSVDFERFCEETCRKGDFVYLDPPYYIPKVRIFREYNQTDFTEEDTARLVKTLDRISGRGASFLLSYPKGDLTMQLSAKWHSTEVKATRSVAGSAAARRSETEVLIANYRIAS